MHIKKILWISRHAMTEEQFTDLKRALGDNIELISQQDTISSIDQLMPDILSADAIAAVLPANLLCDLVKSANGRPVLVAVSKRVATGKYRLCNGKEEQEFTFVHAGWQQILGMEFHAKPL